MTLEAMVVALCIGGFECSTATKAYYAQTPQIKAYAKHVTAKAQDITGPVISYVAPGIIYAATQKTIRIRVRPTLTFDLKQDTVMAIYNTSF